MDKRFTIGVLIGNANSPHTMDLMQGIYRAAEMLEVDVIYFLGIHSSYTYQAYFGKDAVDDYDYQFNIVYDYALLAKADALIVSYGTLCIFLEDKDKTVFLKKFHGIPYVLVEEYDETLNGSSIIADNYNGMYNIVEHLVKEHGYRNLTYLSGPIGNTDADQRRQAFHDVLEKYHLPHEENRIEYGDYSLCVEANIARLLEDYPQMDAMVCANDIMADTVYREFAARGIEVGRDIAVTGYDDWNVAGAMNPPLTTVLQNAYDMGYMALIGALELCNGKKPHAVVVPAQIHIRESCGCCKEVRKTFSLEENAGDFCGPEYIRRISELFVRQILLVNSSPKMRKTIQDSFALILDADYSDPDTHGLIVERLKSFLSSENSKKISLHAMMRVFGEYLDELMEELIHRRGTAFSVGHITRLKEKIMEVITSRIIKTNDEQSSTYQQETWFLPLISRDMIAKMEDEKEFYAAAMLKLSALKAKSSYLYIFEEPIRHRENDEWSCPEKMYLAACHIGEKVIAYREEERPVLTAENGLSVFYLKNESHLMSVFCIFSDEIQYGFLVTEIEPSNLALFYLISMQIANALKFNELSMKQRRTQKKLENLVREINEKNEVLNFVSEYDVLTGCLNRRGFMEHIMQFNKEHLGETAVMIYADLDHLKEINDRFGHNEGDYAIQASAKLLQDIFGKNSVLGRIGGDEFAALLSCDDENILNSMIQTGKEKIVQFNNASGRDYYVEITLGGLLFTCKEGIIFSEILGGADKHLYEAKKKRRPTVLKNPAGKDGQ